jgi:predicted nucleic acid-binding protein
VIALDTNFLITALAAGTTAEALMLGWLRAGDQLTVSIVAWTEFLCGPATPGQISLARAMIGEPIGLTAADAERAAALFNLGGRRRGSLADCMIAATAIRLDVELATANREDFRRFEPAGLRLIVA